MPLPEIFTERMKSWLGTEYPDFETALGQPPPVSIRYNPAKPSDRFPDSAKVPWHPSGRYLPERPSFTLDPAFHGGAYYVQEPSSMFLFEALRQTVDLTKKLRVLDLCASPGGKSTLLLSAIHDKGFVLANEAIRSRVGALNQNMAKWGHPNQAVANHDPADFAGLEGFFDVVLIDAPCSGEGLFRKDPNAVNEWSVKNLELCSARQQRILQTAKNLVKPGGVLVYSTCTFNPDENEKNMEWLIAEGGFEHCLLQLEESWGIVEMEKGYQFYPHKTRGEGFYIACLRKKEDVQASRFYQNLPAFKQWRRLGSKEVAVLEPWIKDVGQFVFFEKPDQMITAVPESQLEDFETIGQVLSRRAFGLNIGVFKKKDFVPSHELALSLAVHPQLPFMAMDKDMAISYLRKENFLTDAKGRGWHLAKLNGINLGWMKLLDNRINNYLPGDWRIRMK
ncbi:MAG: RNA methyltransferase [Lewinellaceae bacterium]|nr:rRNA cytosine-C5-methyltransferase [Saprospiraceae bacterium]MCB9340701.1 RNA methyltransferase [Lewinellaceae bacterium]